VPSNPPPANNRFDPHVPRATEFLEECSPSREIQREVAEEDWVRRSWPQNHTKTGAMVANLKEPDRANLLPLAPRSAGASSPAKCDYCSDL